MIRNSHDHRVKQLVVETRDPKLFEEFGVKPSTARNWIYKGFSTPIIYENVQSAVESKKIQSLKTKLEAAEALVELYESVSEICTISLAKKHIRDRSQRQRILEAIGKARGKVGVTKATKFIGLSISRYKRWRSGCVKCPTTGSPRCHKESPNQLSPSEIATMKEYVTSKKYAHYTIKSLHFRAKRDGKLFCCDDTWYKYIDRYCWKRPFFSDLKKKYSDRVKRAATPNEIIHIDITHIKINTGQTFYLQTVLDNFSRFILEWRLFSKISAANTLDLIKRALEKAKQILPGNQVDNIVSDGGPENNNNMVRNFIDSLEVKLKHRIPKCHIRFSNNMLEVWFRLLKNNYLNYLPANSKKDLLRRLKFFILEYNSKMPLAALRGMTPIEIYTGKDPQNLIEELNLLGKDARIARLSENKDLQCFACL